jgi:hypothetical protein
MGLKDPNVVSPKNRKRVAIVLSNPAVSSTTGWPVGFRWSELAHRYQSQRREVSDPRDSSELYLAKGKTVTGFANAGEDYDNAVWSRNLLSRDQLGWKTK